MSEVHGQRRVELRRRAIGCSSFLLFLGAGPLGIFGLSFYMESADSGGATPMSGLSAVGMGIGIAIMVAAIAALVVGAIFFIRSAKD